MAVDAISSGPRINNLGRDIAPQSPRHGGTSAPVNNILGPPSPVFAPLQHGRPRTPNSTYTSHSPMERASSMKNRRPRAISREEASMHSWSDTSISPSAGINVFAVFPGTPSSLSSRKLISSTSIVIAKAQSRCAQQTNDSMVYLDGPQVYTCSQCRTHLTSHDDIISKSFHGRHGRAYLFDQCVNVAIGPAEDRLLMTGMHSVSDIFCQRCKGMVGWTYAKAYESSQKYKEGKFIIEKINLHLEESDYYDVCHPAGERGDRFRKRTMSWGSEGSVLSSPRFHDVRNEIVYEYNTNGLPLCPRYWESPLSSMAIISSVIPPRNVSGPSFVGTPQAPVL